MQILIFHIILIVILINPMSTAYSKPDGNKLVKTEIISDYKILKPGMKFNIGIIVTPEKDWHTYWRNPGDAGLPTIVDCKLPDGVKAGDVVWEIPEKIHFAGMANFGYGRSNMLIVPIDLPDDFHDTSLVIKVEVNWLVCKEECIPGKRMLRMEIPVAKLAKKNIENADSFIKASNRQAIINDDVKFEVSDRTENDLILEVILPDYLLNIKKLEFYPFEGGYYDNGEPQEYKRQGNRVTLTLKYDKYREKSPSEVFGLLVSDVPFSETLPNKAIIIQIKI